MLFVNLVGRHMTVETTYKTFAVCLIVLKSSCCNIHCLVFLLEFWLRLSLSSAKCDGRTGIFWQTAHRWSMKKKKKITSDIHNPIFLMMDISHLMHGQQNHEYLMIQLSVKSEVSFFFTLFSASTKQGKCTKYVGNRNTCAILKCFFW